MRKKQKNEKIILNKGENQVQLDYTELRKAVLVLRAVNHKMRQTIIALLQEELRLTVTDIYIKLRVEQSIASQQLAILRRAGVVVTEKEGKFVYYSLDHERLVEIARFVNQLILKENPKKSKLKWST